MEKSSVQPGELNGWLVLVGQVEGVMQTVTEDTTKSINL
jgi:hypothetical protein